MASWDTYAHRHRHTDTHTDTDIHTQTQTHRKTEHTWSVWDVDAALAVENVCAELWEVNDEVGLAR